MLNKQTLSSSVHQAFITLNEAFKDLQDPDKVWLFRIWAVFWEASEQKTYADIEAVYKCLEESCSAKQEDVDGVLVT